MPFVFYPHAISLRMPPFQEMSLDTANPPDNPKFQESCKSFDSYGEVRPTRNSFVGKGDKSFETVESGEDEDTTSIVAKHPANPYASASLISKILFLWPSAFIKQAVAGSDGNDDDAPAIQDSDLPDVLDCDSSETNRRKVSDSERYCVSRYTHQRPKKSSVCSLRQVPNPLGSGEGSRGESNAAV